MGKNIAANAVERDMTLRWATVAKSVSFVGAAAVLALAGKWILTNGLDWQGVCPDSPAAIWWAPPAPAVCDATTWLLNALITSEAIAASCFLLMLTLPIAHRLDSIDKARSHGAKTPHGAPSDADGAASRPGTSESPLNQENAHGHLR